jgi:SH3-like domain-containing protein
MNRRLLEIFLVIVVLGMTAYSAFAASPPRMRPYTGIGVVVFNALNQDLPLPLYEEPGLLRVGVLNSSRMSGNEWVFGLQKGGRPPLVVSARKGEWLRVVYDDAGREAWIEPQNQGRFQSWEQYLKLHTGRMLPGLQSNYYRFQQQPGGKVLTTLSPKQMFKVLKIENSWGMVLTDQSQVGWLRWRDDDGRLLFGVGKN